MWRQSRSRLTSGPGSGTPRGGCRLSAAPRPPDTAGCLRAWTVPSAPSSASWICHGSTDPLGRSAPGTVGFGNQAVPPGAIGPGRWTVGFARPYPDSAGRDDRAQAPRSKSATPGGRFLIGRARADLPVELQTLDGNLGRALRRVSAMSLAAPPRSLLALMSISRRYKQLGYFPMVDVPVLVPSPLWAWRRWSSSSSHG